MNDDSAKRTDPEAFRDTEPQLPRYRDPADLAEQKPSDAQLGASNESAPAQRPLA